MSKINLSFMYAFLILTLLSAVMHLTALQLVFMLTSMLVIGICSIVFRAMAGFAALIAYILSLAFYNIAINWGKNVDLWFQGDQITEQAAYSLGAVAAWLLAYNVNHLRQSFLTLQKEAESLRKLEPATGVLTFSEFLEKGKLLFSGMRRRNETGYYLICEIQLDLIDKPYKKRVIYEVMMAKLLDSTRSNYDLVGNYGGSRAIVLLSNTNEQGVGIVLERFQQKLQDGHNLVPELFQVSVNALAIDEWEQFESVIAPLRGGKAS